VICLLSQFGFDEVEDVSEVRKRAGRKDAPSMIAESLARRQSSASLLYSRIVEVVRYGGHDH